MSKKKVELVPYIMDEENVGKKFEIRNYHDDSLICYVGITEPGEVDFLHIPDEYSDYLIELWSLEDVYIVLGDFKYD